MNAEGAQFEARADAYKRGVLLGVEFVSGRRVARIKGILGGIERFLPAFEQAVAQHAIDERTSDIGEPQELRKRKRTALSFEQGANFFFFFGKRCGASLGGRCGLPSDHAQRFSFLGLKALVDLNQAEPLEFLEGLKIET